MHPVLAGIIRSERIASAYLFFGPPGPAKAEAAREFAESLGTRKVDLVTLKPEGATIKIDQIREIQQVVRYGPNAGPRLVAIIEAADKLTPEASAAFLKTLEEPPPGVIFILLVERDDRLPNTILSRCQRVIFGEDPRPPELNEGFAHFRLDLKGIRKKGPLELLDFSARLEKEKEQLEELLYDLVYYAHEELRDAKLSRILLETIKNIKRYVSAKLALDVACLKMGEV
ncbi:MAG: AAA family ATPase [Candidatus Margulisiibacteriota bacterium]